MPASATWQDPRRFGTYAGTVGGAGPYGPTNPAFPPTAAQPPQYPGLHPAITGLLTPGLVPDIARQSAEVSAGRGVAGSPAADSTAVRMSEQDYLQRLGLAHTLMGGEAQNLLPYQITPVQSAEIQTQRDIAGAHYGGGGQNFGGGGGGAVAAPKTPWADFSGDVAMRGTGEARPNTPSLFPGMKGGVDAGNVIPMNTMSLDDIYEQLGFGNFGSLSGDVSGSTEGDWLGE